MRPRKLEQMTEELAAEFIFKDGAQFRTEADGHIHLVWVPFERKTDQPYDEPLIAETSVGELQTLDGRRGKRVILLVREQGAWLKVRSVRHGQGVLKISYGAYPIGVARLNFQPSFRSLLIRLGISIVSITLLVIIFRKWVIEGVAIPKELLGNSMAPTFTEGERIFILKFIYFLRDPVRGEVIVFNQNVISDSEKDGVETVAFVKRVIGVPGDTIEFQNGILIRNGKAVKEPYLSDISSEGLSEVPLVQVPEGQFYVAGDNRPYSNDSRYWVTEDPDNAFVQKKDIRGKAFLVYWPPWRLRFVRVVPGK